MSLVQEEVLRQVIAHLKSNVINQVRYTYPVDEYHQMDADAMHAVADDMTDEQATDMLGTRIISDYELTALASKIGVADVFHNDHWIDPVCDYIIYHKEDCYELWNHIQANV